MEVNPIINLNDLQFSQIYFIFIWLHFIEYLLEGGWIYIWINIALSFLWRHNLYEIYRT